MHIVIALLVVIVVSIIFTPLIGGIVLALGLLFFVPQTLPIVALVGAGIYWWITGDMPDIIKFILFSIILISIGGIIWFIIDFMIIDSKSKKETMLKRKKVDGSKSKKEVILNRKKVDGSENLYIDQFNQKWIKKAGIYKKYEE